MTNTELMPLTKVVVNITHQADSENPESIRKAVKTWHNGFANGTLPRCLVKKFGRELYLRLDVWEQWVSGTLEESENIRSRGRPRSP
jgi:hypothetical protein